MAKQMNDIALDSNYDLKIVNGDFATVESTYMHQRALLASAPGDYKQFPTRCVGADLFLHDENGGRNLQREIALQFTEDGMHVEDLTPNADALTDDTATIFNNSYYI
jgi:hypothetical protein